VSKVVGSEVVGDAVAFFAAFEGMEQGFRDRAERVAELLADSGTAFVLVAAARRDAVDEALYFARRLQDAALRIEALVVNRLYPRYGPVPAVLSTIGDPAAETDEASVPLGALVRNLRELRGIAEREERHVDALVRRVAPAPTYRVPMLATDVHDLAGLSIVAGYLFDRAGSDRSESGACDSGR
jgi:anion-transporting  ArsA/GET3 family ATPase